MILLAISLLMATRDSFTLTMRLPPMVVITVTFPPETKPQILQMGTDLWISADLTNDIFLSHSGQS